MSELEEKRETCETCIYYLHDCLIAGDLVRWCKAYAEVDPHDRLAKLNKGGVIHDHKK